MSNLFYRIRLCGNGFRDFRLPSKHNFPSPVGTELHIWYGEDREELFETNVSFHHDDIRVGVFYMQLDDGNDDPMNIAPDCLEEIEAALLAQGWERTI